MTTVKVGQTITVAQGDPWQQITTGVVTWVDPRGQIHLMRVQRIRAQHVAAPELGRDLPVSPNKLYAFAESDIVDDPA